MRIDRLEIQNFNGFESLEIEFDPHFNLLVGDNASGKTSVLDALSILLDAWLLAINEKEIEGSIPPDSIRVVAYPHQDSYSFEKQYPVRIEISGMVMERNVIWSLSQPNRQKSTTYSNIEQLRQIANETAYKVMKNNLVTLPLIGNYGTERLWFETRHPKHRQNEDIEKSQPSRLDGYEDCNEFEIQETALLQWIRALVIDGIQMGEMPIAFRAMERAIIACVEGAASLKYSVQYKDAIVGITSIRSQPFNMQFFKNLSDGQRIMLTLIGDIVRRATILNPHLGEEVLQKTPGVVLIDELDLHLHPKWQRRIIHALKSTFPAIQFITTTHSPQLIGEAKPNEIRILSDGKVYIPSHSFGLDSSRILGEIQHAPQRNTGVESVIHEIALAIDREQFDEARRLITQLEELVGADDAEVTRQRATLRFMEAPL
jgi:predicted ATP-binding protein involved in virulence